MHLGRRSVVVLLFASIAGAQRMQDFNVPAVAPPDSVLVVGFLGGFEPWNDPHRGVRKVALSLRSLELPDTYVETVENRHSALALKLIERFAAGDGRTSQRGRRRIILYGQSWGGAAVLQVARELEKSGIRVCLTVQVDSVGLHDDVVPENVDTAANLFQHDWLGIQGRREIRAENPAITRILENTQLSYLFRSYSSLNASDASWIRRTFGGSHAKMELDGSVWTHVEGLILAAIRNQL